MRNLLRIFPYLRRARRLLAVVLVLSILGQFSQLLIPKVIGQIVQNALARDPRNIAPEALLIIGLAMLSGGFRAAETYLGTRLGQTILLNLRQDIYAHLCRFHLRFFDRTRTGELLSRVTADLEPIETFFSWGSRLILRSILLFVGALIFCLQMNARLTLLSLTIVPLISVTAFILGLLIRPAWQAAREQVGAFTSALEETLSGIRVVKMSTQEKTEIAKLTRSSDSVRHKTWLTNRLDAAYYPVTNLWAGLAGLMILAIGGAEVINGNLTLSQYVTFEIYLMLLLVPMRMLGWMVSGAQRAAVGAGRILNLLDEKPELPLRASVAAADKSSTKAPQLASAPISGAVTFEGVSFGYREDEIVLREINLQVAAGETLGILGSTGSGKSALVALVPRLYDPLRGRVLIDGRDIREYDLQALRRQIGMVFQEAFLFSGTIRENIAFGRHDASAEIIEEAARQAALHDFVAGLEKGYETIIGERGLNLSGGQQQRLALARTLLMDPRILILDDCTSSVDAQTEFYIQQALKELMANRTSFIIAQRASSVAVADKIIVLDEGRIVEYGTPAELARVEGGLYRRLLGVQEALGVGPHERFEVMEQAN